MKLPCKMMAYDLSSFVIYGMYLGVNFESALKEAFGGWGGLNLGI